MWLGRLTDCTHCTGQFTPKMKANAEPRLLSSLVWIDQYNVCNRLTALIIFGKIHFLLISENEFTHEIKRDGITSFHGIQVTLFSKTLTRVTWYYHQTNAKFMKLAVIVLCYAVARPYIEHEYEFISAINGPLIAYCGVLINGPKLLMFTINMNRNQYR